MGRQQQRQEDPQSVLTLVPLVSRPAARMFRTRWSAAVPQRVIRKQRVPRATERNAAWPLALNGKQGGTK